MTMMIMMIIITFCALDILILEFLPCKWQFVWNMLIKDYYLKKKIIIIIIIFFFSFFSCSLFSTLFKVISFSVLNYLLSNFSFVVSL